MWVLGSWDGWRAPGISAVPVEPGVWQARQRPLPPGRYAYKFLVDGVRWQDDPANPHKAPDTFGGLNSLLIVPADEVPIVAGEPGAPLSSQTA